MHDYSCDVDVWITHLRRVHSEDPLATINGKVVKASNPLAPPDEGLCYAHSKTAYYNSFFFEFWDLCFAKTFGLICPFYEFNSVQDLEDLLDAKVQRYAMLMSN